MQLNIDFDKRTNSRENQPYHYQEVENIIKVEESIKNFSRKSWEDKIEYYQNKQVPDDFIILDHENKNIILFLNQLRANPKKLTNGTQIIRHWLFGQTMGTELPEEIKDIKLTENELGIFFKGSPEDIMKYRESHNIHNKKINLGWILYHYDGKLFSDSDALKMMMDDYFKAQYEKYNDYDLRLSYGIVSEKHQRTDKKEMIKIVEKLLIQRGFEVGKPKLLNDYSRNGEPILLWIARNYIEETEYKAAIGINFGYDNGLSGYRLGLGVYFTEERLLAHIDKIALKKTVAGDESSLESYNFAYEPWIHHKNFGFVEKIFEEFIIKYFDKFYDNLVMLLENSKKQNIRKDTFSRLNMNIHRKDFNFINDGKENTKQREKIIRTTMEKYGANKFSQFLAWQKIAENIDDNHSKEKSLAHFISSCILSGQYG